MRYVTITCADLIVMGLWQPEGCDEDAHLGEGERLIHIRPWKRRPRFPDQGLQRMRIRATVCMNAARALYKLPSSEWARVARVAKARERGETVCLPGAS